MSKEYIDSIKDTDKLSDALIISLLGMIGLYQLNTNNNLLKLQFKKYKQILTTINDNDLDIYTTIQELFKQKLLRTNYAISLVNLLQQLRTPTFSLEEIEMQLKDILEKMPASIIRKATGDVKFLLRAYMKDAISLTKLVNKFFTLAQRKDMTELDFYKLAKRMKRQELKPTGDTITNNLIEPV